MSTHATDLVVVPAGAGETLDVGPFPLTLKCTSAQTGGAYTLVEQPIAPRLLSPPHVHTHEDQLTYILEGTIGFKIGDTEITLGSGATVFRPRGIPHALWNPTDHPARILEITSPGIMEAYFRGAAAQPGQDHGALAATHDLVAVPEWVPYLSEKYAVSPDGVSLR